MGLSQNIAPVRRALTLEDAKRRAGLADIIDPEIDVLFAPYLDAAIRFVGNDLNRQLITATWVLTLDEFPSDEIVLEWPPFQSLMTFQYLDTDEATQTVSSALYALQTDREPGKIYLKQKQSWPSTSAERDAVTVTYKAGFGDDPSDVPETMRTAIGMLATHWYENRASITDERLMHVPQAYEALIWQERVPFV